MRKIYKRLGDYIQEVKVRNTELETTELLGVNIDKFFMPSVANIVGTDMSVYKIVKPGQFACNRMHVGRDMRLPVALSDKTYDFIVSPAYDVFEIIDTTKLLPEYLMMWFSRIEFDRNAWFYTDADVRGGLNWKALCDMQLPVPSIDKQKETVKEYHVLVERITMNNGLIQKLEETAQAIYKQWFVDFEFPVTLTPKEKKYIGYKSIGGEMEEGELGIIPKGWIQIPLSKVASYINRGITPSYVEIDGIIVINQKCVKDNSIDFSYSRRHNDKIKKIDPDRYLQLFDILVNSTGEGTLGRVGLVKEKHSQLIVDTHITIVRTSDILMPLCLWFSLSSRTDEIEKLAEGSTGQTELGRKNLGELKILIPSNYAQKQFEKIATSIIAHSSKIENELHVLISLKELLLSKLATIEN